MSDDPAVGEAITSNSPGSVIHRELAYLVGHPHTLFAPYRNEAIVNRNRVTSLSKESVFSASVHESFGGVWYRWLSKHDFVEDS